MSTKLTKAQVKALNALCHNDTVCGVTVHENTAVATDGVSLYAIELPEGSVQDKRIEAREWNNIEKLRDDITVDQTAVETAKGIRVPLGSNPYGLSKDTVMSVVPAPEDTTGEILVQLPTLERLVQAAKALRDRKKMCLIRMRQQATREESVRLDVYETAYADKKKSDDPNETLLFHGAMMQVRHNFKDSQEG